LFGEAQSRVVVTCDASNLPAIQEVAASFGVSVKEIGKTGGKEMIVNSESFGAIGTFKELYNSGLTKHLIN
jgi:phosphoribosylformylglycinamidine synthase subunit PurL